MPFHWVVPNVVHGAVLSLPMDAWRHVLICLNNIEAWALCSSSSFMLTRSHDLLHHPTELSLRLEQFEPLYWKLAKIQKLLWPPTIEIESSSSDDDHGAVPDDQLPPLPDGLTLDGIIHADISTLQYWLPVLSARNTWLTQRQALLTHQLQQSATCASNILQPAAERPCTVTQHTSSHSVPIPPIEHDTVTPFNEPPNHTCMSTLGAQITPYL